MLSGGETIALQDEIGLSTGEKAKGWILSCVRTAVSSLQLDVLDLTGIEIPPRKTLPCRIDALERLNADVLQVTLRLPPSSNFEFFPGQYIDMIAGPSLRRSYSIANAPRADKRLDLHVREVPGGAMSAYWFHRAKVNDLLRLDGPLGTFFLREISDRNLVFLATGTGIAPVRAMLQGLAAAGPTDGPRSVSVYWGARDVDDLYCEIKSGAPEVSYKPVLSRANSSWSGARGHVQDIFLGEKPDLANTAVYACGSEAMISSARARLIQAGLPPNCFESDAFVCSI